MVHNHTMVVDNYGVWRSELGAVPFIPYKYRHEFAVERRFWNAAAVHRFILNYWHLSLAIVCIYVLVIHGIRHLMRNRPPFRLQKPLIIWNSALALFSIMGLCRSGEEFLFTITERGFHDSVCFAYDPDGIASLWNFLFMTSKIAELNDTIFIVLRKRELIFLHWYHHAAVLIVSWHGARMIIAPSRWFIFMNFAVHSVMYTYYAISSTGYRLPRLLAMTVTTLQNIQMLIGVYMGFYVAKVKWWDGDYCHMSGEELALCFFVYATFAVLFIRFFIGAYFSKIIRSDRKKIN